MTDTFDTRNKLIHHYDGINLDIVWETATISIPPLEPLILAILKPENPSS